MVSFDDQSEPGDLERDEASSGARSEWEVGTDTGTAESEPPPGLGRHSRGTGSDGGARG